MPIYKRYLKSNLDFIFALLLLIIMLPLLILVTLLLFVTSLESPFFLQSRTGINGRNFQIIKFKTMKNLLDEEGQLLPDDLRMSPFTRTIRKINLDELPQLINILKGEMSFIGPRPLPIRYEALYSKEQFKRHAVRPGITGLAQVHGRRSLGWKSRFALDVSYTEEVSMLLDFSILIRTAKVFLDKSNSEVSNGQSPDEYIPNFSV
jgi:undecaprenyl phosphate N,N'-diacetylbacillosamine 1-phosphate transferase